MAPFLRARAVNDVFGDPTLFLDFQYAKRALLFDIGNIENLTAGELLRVSHVFVSHAHVDHFYGFDRMLRHRLDRVAPLHFVGPRDFIARVEGKLGAYTWNLLNRASVDFAITVAEFSEGQIIRRSVFRARHAFRREEDDGQLVQASAVVLDEPDFSVTAAVIDHGIPCLALAFEEKPTVHVVKDKLAELGLLPGGWLNHAKRAVRLGKHPSTPIATDGGPTVELGDLQRHCLKTMPGQKVVYVVDAADHKANRDSIVILARGADQLFIEAAFADEDVGLARERHHLTAGAAGRLARETGAKSVVPLHASARYAGQGERLAMQLERAFRPASNGIKAAGP